MPENKAAEIVMPLLDIPGNKARTWNKPIKRDFFILKVEEVLVNFVKSKINPVKMKAIPKNKKEEKVSSINFLNIKPKIAAGIVARIR